MISAVQWLHLFLQTRLPKGAIAIDATAGNGHDSLFLSQFTSEQNGHLYLIDIQSDALDASRALLLEHQVAPETCSFLHASHADLTNLIPTSHHGFIDAILFNLGYRPGHSKTLTTRCDSTLLALQASLPLLKRGGILSIIAYPGHPEGAKERELIEPWLRGLPSNFTVQQITSLNRINPPPVLWIVQTA